MPARNNFDYKRPLLFASRHIETIYPALFRKVNGIGTGVKERLELSDGDFLDLVWRKNSSKKLVIIQHGLEGSADRPYILGMAKVFLLAGYDTLAWNYRSCSGEMNRLPIFYHSGATQDLDAVVQHALGSYDHIHLIGFSLGGNLTLKYLGEIERPEAIKSAVAFSSPLDLSAGVDLLKHFQGMIYDKRFVRLLGDKIKQKALIMPDQINVEHLKNVKTLRDFDEYYTAPLNGFKDSEDYYQQCSSINFLKGITVPTLICNALNDPILSPESLNHGVAENLEKVHLETTHQGGHVGFGNLDKNTPYWSELRALRFVEDMKVSD